MKPVVCLLGTLIVTTAIGTPAHAQNYPWCAYYSGRALGGAINCGFTTFQQCLATVSGIGGFCEPNTVYRPPPGPHRRYSGYQYYIVRTLPRWRQSRFFGSLLLLVRC